MRVTAIYAVSRPHPINIESSPRNLNDIFRYTDANGRRDTKATRSTADKFDGKCRCYFCTNKINAKWSNLPKNKFAEQNIKDAIPHFQELKKCVARLMNGLITLCGSKNSSDS